MNGLKIELKNCYGIHSLDHEFDFDTNNGKKAAAYAIYAPNGLMKTSFTKTFEALSKGEEPREERYGRATTCNINVDGQDLPIEVICVLRSEIDIGADSPAITNILVNPENKARYDSLLVDQNKQLSKLLTSLQKTSKIKKAQVEGTILQDWGESDLFTCIQKAKEASIHEDLSPYEYATIFDPKTASLLKSEAFTTKADEFNKRYQELFSQPGSIYQKGVFNPAKAEASFSALDKQGFFAGGHRVHLRGETDSIDKDALNEKLEAIHAQIDGDDQLRELRTSLAKNAQTQALTNLIENLSSSQVELLLSNLQSENLPQFRKDLWSFYIQNDSNVDAFIESYSSSKDELAEIEQAAAEVAPRWSDAVDLFNDRFVDMPFSLSIANQTQAALGKEQAKLKFTFEDGADSVEWMREQVKTLSQGEKRALYLLNFIFEVEARKQDSQETLFIIDDVADSFDYKNKHAIVQYLEDLSKTDHFYQIILTHNFDFFRTIANNFVNRTRCLMANRSGNEISLVQAEGIKNYFIGKWKNQVCNSDSILCATIPFTRNLIEYIKGEEDVGYLRLTSLLHWKEDTDQITVGDYLSIYNDLFGTSHPTDSNQLLTELLFNCAREICDRNEHDGLILEDKVLISMAIRLQAEIFLTEEIRRLTDNSTYWCQKNNQFGYLMKQYAQQGHCPTAIRVLEKVSITVSSNIHLNSFMYEPILDLTIEHLIKLYQEIQDLKSTSDK